MRINSLSILIIIIIIVSHFLSFSERRPSLVFPITFVLCCFISVHVPNKILNLVRPFNLLLSSISLLFQRGVRFVDFIVQWLSSRHIRWIAWTILFIFLFVNNILSLDCSRIYFTVLWPFQVIPNITRACTHCAVLSLKVSFFSQAPGLCLISGGVMIDIMHWSTRFFNNRGMLDLSL